MSKIIRMTPEMIEESKRKFEARLQNMNLANGTLTYTETFQATNQKAVVWITPDAYTKMIALIQDSEKEVAWHGVAHRLEAEGQYVITDILVYPQEVTGATVNTDQAEYEQWMMNLEDDIFNNLRMQGHSHVRMDCFPSHTDLEHQKKIIQQLEGDMFYIFMIWNKYFKFHATIYDLKINTLFEHGDVSVHMVGAGAGLKEFLDESRAMVKTRTYNTGNSYGGNYGGYNQGAYSAPKSTPATTPAATATKTPASTTTPATTPKSATADNTVTPKEEKKDNVVPSRPKTCIGNGWQGAANSGYNNYYDDDEDYSNPHGGCYH